MEKFRKEKNESGFESWIEKLEETKKTWKCMLDSKITGDYYIEPEKRAELEKARKNKLRASYFDGIIRYCNLIIDELSSQQLIPEEDAKVLRASLSSMRESFYHNKLLNSDSEQISQVKELDKIASNILEICESLNSKQQKAA